MKTKINSQINQPRRGTSAAIYLATLICLALSVSGSSFGKPKTPELQSALDTHGVMAESGNRTGQAVSNSPQRKVEQRAAPSNEAPSPNLITSGTYVFSNSSGASLEDMSSSTALLLPADLDDTASNFGSIGFDFWFDGVRQTIFSANANGEMRLGTTVIGTTFTNSLASTTDAPKICPYFDDLWIGTGNGKVHYKVVGTAPNRKLVVEWKNEQIPRVATANPGAGTFQAWLYESTGKIEFVYGSGIAANSANSGYSVGIQAGAATNFASVTTSSNTVSYAVANDTNTGAITAGTKYTFTPNIPADPTGLNYTAVGLNTMTLNWTDNATNEFGYAIYRSLDGVNYEFISQTAANANSFIATGLASNTTYFWKVFAVSEGGLSANPATGPNAVLSQATLTGTLSGTLTVGPTGNYASLTAAITDINTNGLAGNLILELQAAYTSGGETFPLVINAFGSPSNTITIRPESGAAGLSITSANATGTIDLNPATNVIIDGRAAGVGPSQLTIANTALTGFAVRYLNGASRNTIQYCTIAGVENTATNAVVLFGTSTGATGNNNNNINNCDIRDGATTPVNCILGLGTIGTNVLNTGNTITANNVFNFHSATIASNGINANNGSNWTITNNRIFQTAPRASTAAITHRGILVVTQPGFDNVISNNVVGFANSSGTGTYTMTSTAATGFVGIQLQGSITNTNSIQGNTVAGISHGTTSGAITGISVTGGSADVGTITGNTVGSGTGNGSITQTSTVNAAFIVGMNVSTSTGHINVANNTIGSLTSTGSPATINPNLNVTQMTAGSMSITNNLFGSTTTANSIQITTPGTAATAQQMIGMLAGSTNPLTIANNTMANLTNAGTGTNTSQVIRGIQNQSPGLGASNANGKCSIVSNMVHDLTGSNANTNTFGNTVGIFFTTSSAAQPNGGLVDQNTVYTINATNAGAVNTVAGGIYFSNPAGGVVSNNNVYDIRNASTGTTATTPPVAYGIEVQAGPTFQQLHNNMISLGNSQTTNTEFIGIWNNFNTIATIRSWYNSVHIEGAPAAGALPSYCFLRGDNTAASAITSPVDIKNNIYDNTRSGGTGKHYAIGNVNTAPASGWIAGASNNNVLNSAAAATVGIWGLATDETFPNWQAASGGDGASLSAVSVMFVNPATANLHMNFGLTPTPLESGGVVIPALTIDYDMQTRPGPPGSMNGGGTSPDIGADEFDGVPIDVAAPAISYTPLGNTLSTADRTLTATLTDVTGVPTSGSFVPRIYYKKNAGSYFSQPGTLTSGNGNNGTWDFTIVVSDVGGVTSGDVISYFVIAQDTLGNIGSNPAGAVATDVNNVTTPPSSPNTYMILFTISGTKTIGAAGDYPDITTAINAPNGLNNSVIVGPVTFVLIDASYTNGPQTPDAFPITINANSGSSSTNTVTFKPLNPGTTITGSAASALFILNGADWMIFDGSSNNTSSRDLTITNTNTGTSSAVMWLQSTGADGATNNTIKNLNLVGNSNTTTLVGLGSGSSTISVTSTGTGNNNNTFQNNNLSKSVYGIYAGGASAANKATGNVISGNLINSASPNNVQIGGILVKFQDGIQITRNSVANISQSSGAFGIGLGLGDSITNLLNITSGSDVTNAIVSRNSIDNVVSTSSTGFSAAGIIVNPVTSGITQVDNNMISRVVSQATPSDATFGIFAMGGAGSTTRVYYNSISMTGNRVAATNPSYALAIGGLNPIVDVRDNIFYNTQTGTSSGKMYAIGTASTTFTNMTSNYNDFFVSGANTFIGQTGGLGTTGTDRATLAAWQGATGTDANSISADPVFASTTDLHITSLSPVVCLAIPIATVTTDIDGDARDTFNPDIGADELLAPAATGAVSRKVHGGAGTFDISLPGIECRTGGGSGVHQIVVTFASPVTFSGASVTSGTGMVSGTSGNGTNTITIDLSGVTNNQNITVTIGCVNDGVGSGDVSVTMTVLLGDVTASGSVNSGDVAQTKASGGPATAGTFRADVNVSGIINSSDIGLVKSQIP